MNAGRIVAALACLATAAAVLLTTASAGPARDVEVRATAMPNDPYLRYLSWPITQLGLPRAWDLTDGSPTVTVAVLDTGVANVPDLAGALVPGIDLVNHDDDPADDNGHGTAVASIVGARTNNGLAIAGVCGRCSIMPVKVLGADATGVASTVAAGV